MQLPFIFLFGFILSTKQCSAARLVSVTSTGADGKSLVDLGNTFNSSMLKLVGHAFVNLDGNVKQQICKNVKCARWSSWSNCTTNSRIAFGYRKRTRRCWYSSSSECAQDGLVTIETDAKVCEGKCRGDYNVTANNFCLKLHYNTTKRPEAELQCQSEGGHLMNADTKERWSDLSAFISHMGYKNIWIDGYRTSIKAPWTFASGSNPKNQQLDFWYSGEPSNNENELCLATDIRSGKRHWFDKSCKFKNSFVCEIRG